jgi:GH35 family endo-1,4-beta-xylanase
MVRIGALLTGLMLLSSMLAFNARAQEVRRLGLNTTLRTYGEDIKYVQELGVGTIRVPLQWQLVRIRPGEYDWSTIDRLVKAAQTKQIEVLFNIRTTFLEGIKKLKKDLKRRPIEISPPSMDVKEWVHFVETLANRYRGQGVNYEIENEENFWKGTQEEYLEILKTGYDVIKKADPKAKVLPSAAACMSFSNFQSESERQEAWKWHDKWLQPILSNKKFDVVNIHNYYFPSDIVANGLTFRGYLEHIQDLMKKSGLRDHPIWITEIGYVGNGSPDQQAKWLREAYQQAFESGAERIYWLLLRDRKEPYFGSMGLADAKGDPRPAWNALSQFRMGKERDK